jgi:GNAT superfamily N-acetyltransferase
LRLRNVSEFEDQIYTPDFLKRYPAHLHINLLSGYQGKGLGKRLMEVFEDRMRIIDVRGIHLITSTENRKAVPFYKKLGYEPVKELPDILWDRKSPPGTKSLVFGKRF